ncbi:GAF sensor signal transduction histidine kinase [Gluconacetobacter diazotrophicus PA1 5]|uniref:GAF domain-containing sensor histidine kinase n=1 Tax=Gluconacetobacter diazotrophicus TaxID=33996 RepID=UPI000173C178|nr:GAF domain-containing sensor histidine kinase [Gluconacetobacter diazotrophicus]ACI52076.1 GAF sensor signal transduction histidine kinase [Gluconacetobacter diazotrophicus PA1 5]TWB03052.1 signal transduction histidine kinase [Gluconacetobacter diazotrophicus]
MVKYLDGIRVAGRVPALLKILDVVQHTTSLRFAAVARVTPEYWLACAVRDGVDLGLEIGDELPLETTISHDVLHRGEAVVINHVDADPAYARHVSPRQYHFQSYIVVPVRLPDGTFFGTLCAADPAPHDLDRPEILAMFRLFADLVAFHVDASSRLAENEAILSHERTQSELREQFIAVLGHDLRNPLMSIESGTRMLLRYPERAAELVPHIQKSTARMGALINDLMDFARGRLGGGITLQLKVEHALQAILEQIVQEVKTTRPERRIETRFQMEHAVTCDTVRLAQLFSNLLSNAVTHGDPDKPIVVRASTNEKFFELSVSNAGKPIPPEAHEKLFHPFFRGGDRPSQQGLGLGLYIVSEIAKAHRGRLAVTSGNDETCFTFRLPYVFSVTDRSA